MAKLLPPSPAHPNDEAILEDWLGHHRLVKLVGDRIKQCSPPYVIGIGGNWGAGKTSFLRKLWVYLGGEWNHSGNLSDDCKRWFGENHAKPETKGANAIHPIWFNPWQHQFESSPVVALLQEIRRDFSIGRKMFDKAGKLANVTAYSGLSMLGELTKASPVPLPSINPKDIMERGREYESERFAATLSSQRFREFFEGAIGQLVGKGRLVIFIDDLDRCEGDTAYRLLESLKLYLNAGNCVYVLGLDQTHIEETIAQVLKVHRARARDYLGKMFQCQFLLPVPATMTGYIESVLNDDDIDFGLLLKDRFGNPNRKELAKMLDRCLPHNPRKVKAFISAWKLYLALLAGQEEADAERPLDWRITVVLNYLGQFEEPLFRKVEESPGWFSQHVLQFCRKGSSSIHSGFDGLELPFGDPLLGDQGATDGFASSTPISATQASEAKSSPAPRTFWILRLISEIHPEPVEADIRRHLVRGGVVKQE